VRALRYVTADVFTDRQFGGNPLAVVLDGRGLTGDEMLAVTREFNYSETTFVLPPERGGAARVRIFTPGGEVPFAGHPTVGTAHVLFATGALGAGPAPTAADVTDRARGERRRRAGCASARAPPARPTPASAGASRPSRSSRPPRRRASATRPTRRSSPRRCRSTPATCSAATTRRASGRAGCRSRSWPCATARRWAGRACGPTPGSRAFPAAEWGRGVSEGLLVFAMDGERADARARVFVPELAVPEDPATGSACAALGGYLARRTPRADGRLAWTSSRASRWGRPSLLHVSADKRAGEVAAVRVGGESVVVSEGTLYLRAGAGGLA
jgi:trans-2,3-dihydro-3-hydroxyanthranilate isomerase